MSEFDQDVAVEAESSPASQPADTSQATTQPVQQNGGQSVPYPRFQEVNTRMQQAERRVQQYEARIAQLEQAREQTGKPVSDEERQLKEARDAFYDKVAPELKGIPEMLTGMAQERFVSTGERQLETFAKQHGLDPAALSDSLADIIRSDPALMARAQKGDVTLVSQYLRGLAPVVASLKQQGQQAQRQGVATLGQTKQNVRNLAPRSAAGTTPGTPAPEKFDPSKETGQSYWEKALQKARSMSAGMAAEG